MFNKKSSVNPAAVMHAQGELEKVINAFEALTFSKTVGNVTVTLFGSRKLASIISADGEKVSPQDVQLAFQDVSEDMEHQRNIKLVQIRNAVMKKYKTDIQSLVPDIAAAVTALNAKQAANA